MICMAQRYDVARLLRQHKQSGGVGHHGDVANILAALGEPPRSDLYGES